MGSFLISIFMLSKPIFSINIPGVDALFEYLAMLLTILLGLIAITNLTKGKKLALSKVEFSIIVFIVWACLISIIYFEDADYKILFKWILPPISYLIFRRAFNNKFEAWKSIRWLLIGYAIPIVYSTYLIWGGKGLWNVNYWTGESRYTGAYSGPHEIAHSLGLFIIMAFIYVYLGHVNNFSRRRINIFHILIIPLVIMSTYCIYKASVRTVFVGLAVFAFVWLYNKSKVMLVLATLIFCSLLVVFSSTVEKIFFDVTSVAQGTRSIEEAGSGRPGIWRHNLEVFELKSVDRYFAGVGIGNFDRAPSFRDVITEDSKIWNSHNDWLETIMETGLIGFVMVVAIYYYLIKAALRMPKQERSVFIAFIAAVIVMNLLSNSYISRFPIAQIFFIYLAYMELPFANKHGRATRIAQHELSGRT